MRDGPGSARSGKVSTTKATSPTPRKRHQQLRNLLKYTQAYSRLQHVGDTENSSALPLW
jgi:hypothetical protein